MNADLREATNRIRFEHDLGEKVARCVDKVQSGEANRAECSVLGNDGHFYKIVIVP